MLTLSLNKDKDCSMPTNPIPLIQELLFSDHLMNNTSVWCQEKNCSSTMITLLWDIDTVKTEGKHGKHSGGSGQGQYNLN